MVKTKTTLPAGWREVKSEADSDFPILIGGGMSEKVKHILDYDGNLADGLDGLWEILKRYEETEDSYVPYFCYRGDKDVVYSVLDPERLQRALYNRLYRREFGEDEIKGLTEKIYGLFKKFLHGEADHSIYDFQDCIETAIGSCLEEDKDKTSGFDPHAFNLPFYPGDPLYWVDKDLMKVRIQKHGIVAVAITSHGILIQQPDSAELTVPDSDEFCCVTPQAAKEKLAAMKQEYPIRDYVPKNDNSWIDPAKYLPKDNQIVLVTTDDGHVQQCAYFRDWPYTGNHDDHDIFVSYHRVPRTVDIVSWRPLPEPDLNWRKF